MSDADDVLARAASELREHEEPGWSAASRSVLRAVRGATRRSVPLEAAWPSGADGADRLLVSDLVVVRLVAAALRAVDGVAPGRVVLAVRDRRCEGAEVQVVARYGTDLAAAARQVRAVVVAVLDDVLGPVGAGAPARAVDVVVDDVVVHDPRA